MPKQSTKLKPGRPPGSIWNFSGGLGTPVPDLPPQKTRDPLLATIPRRLLEDAWTALDRLVHAAAGRRNHDRFELAVEEGIRVLAMKPTTKRRA